MIRCTGQGLETVHSRGRFLRRVFLFPRGVVFSISTTSRKEQTHRSLETYPLSFPRLYFFPLPPHSLVTLIKWKFLNNHAPFVSPTSSRRRTLFPVFGSSFFPTETKGKEEKKSCLPGMIRSTSGAVIAYSARSSSFQSLVR